MLPPHPSVFLQHWVEPKWISQWRTVQSSSDPVLGETGTLHSSYDMIPYEETAPFLKDVLMRTYCGIFDKGKAMQGV